MLAIFKHGCESHLLNGPTNTYCSPNIDGSFLAKSGKEPLPEWNSESGRELETK